MTAVEYLVEQLLPKALSAEQYYYIQQAKEMEKKQIIKAYEDGSYDSPLRVGDKEQYYKYIYGNKRETKE